MRNLLLTSTAAVCLVLAGQVANAQSDQKKEELKKEQVQQQQQQKRDQQVQQQQNRTTGQAAEEKKNEEKKNQAAEEKKNEPSKGAASSSEKKDQNAATKPSSETPKSAQSEKSKREEMKKSAEEQKQNATPSKSTASEQNKATQSTKPSTAEAPKSSTAPKQENAATPSSNTNATNTTTNKSPTTNTANQAQPSSKTSAAQLDPQKKVQISETISKQRDLAPPVRNTNISITIGQRVPRDIRLHRLPREIVTIAPEYRDYEYFTTEEDVVIVSPRTHEIVTEISRDPSRARAQVTGGSSSGSSTAMSSNASSGSMPCQVMQRTASGDMQPMDPSQLRQTTGSGGQSDRLAVRVQAPNGQQMPEVTLPDREGRIIAEANGSDCRIILEPGQVGR